MHRSSSIRTRASRTPAHPPAGAESASVGHGATHGMSGHMRHAVAAGSSAGVPAASPAPAGRVMIAPAGQARTHSPQRVHAAMKPASGSAPGGRM